MGLIQRSLLISETDAFILLVSASLRNYSIMVQQRSAASHYSQTMHGLVVQLSPSFILLLGSISTNPSGLRPDQVLCPYSVSWTIPVVAFPTHLVTQYLGAFADSTKYLFRFPSFLFDFVPKSSHLEQNLILLMQAVAIRFIFLRRQINIDTELPPKLSTK